MNKIITLPLLRKIVFAFQFGRQQCMEGLLAYLRLSDSYGSDSPLVSIFRDLFENLVATASTRCKL